MKPNASGLEDESGGEQRTSASGFDSRYLQGASAQPPTPLPRLQVFVLCTMSFAESISIFVIIPFQAQMVEELGVTSDPSELGFYLGLLAGMFSFTQFFTIYFWGALSDRIGRRPVLIIGLCGVIGSTIMFGLSKSFTMVLVSRALSGILNGNSAIVKSALGEITDETNRGTAFPYVISCWSLGSLLAPGIGGFLSHPAERYPFIFGFELLRQYPYLPPCLVGSALSTVGLVIGILFLVETLPRDSVRTGAERRSLLVSKPQTYTRFCPASALRPDQNSRPTSVKDITRDPYVRKVLVSYGFMTYITAAIHSLMVLWMYTPVEAGGMGFSTAEIGTALLLSGLSGKIITLIVYPPLERRMGALYLFRCTMIMKVSIALAFPLGHICAIAGGKKGAYLGVGAMPVVLCAGGVAYVSNMLLITHSAPCKRSLGTINGLAQMTASVSRAVAPVMANSLFAFSTKRKILGGNLVWLVLSLVAFLGVVVACQIPSDRPPDAESQRRD
ncbi:unnamed protein product [Rhizoctonia solani]|uniref:Major facilitator superfamily (MFS) profile domain-containing protein n=1 Tax=Rhizoctonia solani TaxID=456999 RepID=A0A8H3BBM8_9AGAM|nr:unnamed protein product [Rhizoctonia solani]